MPKTKKVSTKDETSSDHQIRRWWRLHCS